MNPELRDWIHFLEEAWSKPTEFLGLIRIGVFDQQEGANFIAQLKNIKPPKESSIDRRLVTLLWYMPIFLEWNKQRLAVGHTNAVAFEQTINQLQEIVEKILGVP